MSDIEKAINAMKNIENFWTYRPSEVEAAKLAIAALGKQMPKKPLLIELEFEEIEYQCPVCGMRYWHKNGVKYCNNCGQKLD